MRKKLQFLSVLLLFSATAFGQQNTWKKSSSRVETEMREKNVNVSEYSLFTLNTDEIKNQLQNASDFKNYPLRKGVMVKFPNLQGGFDTYEVFESSTMHPDLQSRYSEIRSYTGFKKDDKSSTIRFSIDPYFGLTGMMSNNESIFYIDSYTKDNNVYKMYDRKKASSISTFECLFNEQTELKQSDLTASKTVVDALSRKYRLAIATTIEYTAFIAQQAGVATGTDAQKKAAVLAAVNLAVTRLNEVFHKDIAVRFELIANNDALFFISSDTYDTLDAGQMINQNVTVINGAIGAANYDIGHLFFRATAGNDNGLAQTPAVCLDGKARGVTGSASPVGDPFVIDYVAHEMGHQFGANHVQNNNCNRNNATSVEPGSASSIMGYAGICPPNVQQNSDAYFNAISVNEMYTRLTTGATSVCGTKTSINNAEPIVNAGLDRSIPKSTPFLLTGTATDANNDALTYTWEQQDAGAATMPPLPTNTVGPLFRSVKPSTSPSRYFPRLATIVGGYDPNVTTPTDYRAWEKLSSIARTLNFSLLVRDNNALGGQTGRDDVKLTVVSTAGPFVVTSQNAPGTVWTEGQSQTITWDVANTTAAPVSTPNVTILMSTDGGLTFPHILVASTPNDGSHTLTVPGGLGNSTNARIMVKALENVFLNVNSSNITVNSSAVVVPPIPNPGVPGTPGNPGAAPSPVYEGLMVYPIPSTDGFVHIKVDLPRLGHPHNLTYSVYAMDGKLVVPKKTLLFFANTLERINLTHVPSASYILQIELDGVDVSKKIVIIR